MRIEEKVMSPGKEKMKSRNPNQGEIKGFPGGIYVTSARAGNLNKINPRNPSKKKQKIDKIHSFFFYFVSYFS